MYITIDRGPHKSLTVGPLLLTETCRCAREIVRIGGSVGSRTDHGGGVRGEAGGDIGGYLRSQRCGE
jgi:hypothetical protein